MERETGLHEYLALVDSLVVQSFIEHVHEQAVVDFRHGYRWTRTEAIKEPLPSTPKAVSR